MTRTPGPTAPAVAAWGRRRQACKARLHAACALILAALCTASGRADAAPACRVLAPREMVARPARWLGDCPRGAAEGLGILRGGTREPYDLFMGRMRDGRPRDGLMIVRGDVWLYGGAFAPDGSVVEQREIAPDASHQLFVRAAAAAERTAARFAAQGNAASAAYYRALARRVRDGEPE